MGRLWWNSWYYKWFSRLVSSGVRCPGQQCVTLSQILGPGSHSEQPETDRHDINRGIKTKIQIYTIGIILASRRSRISILAHPSDHVRTPRFGNLPARSHINKWLTVPVTWSYSSNVIQYQMCKQLIKRTSVIVYTLYLIVANWLLTEMHSLVSSVKTRQV